MSTTFINRDDLSLVRFACGEHHANVTRKPCFEITTTTSDGRRGMVHMTLSQLVDICNILRNAGENLDSYKPSSRRS